MHGTNVARPAAPQLLDEVRWVVRLEHYNLRTEKVYVGWIRALSPLDR